MSPTFTWARANVYPLENFSGTPYAISPQNNLMRGPDALMHPARSLVLNPARYYDQMMFFFFGMPSIPQIPYLGFEQHGILPGIPPSGDFTGPFIQVWNVKQDRSGPMRENLSDYQSSLPGPTASSLPTSAILLRTRRRNEFRWWTGRLFPGVWDAILKWVLDNSPLPVNISADPVETLWLPYPANVPGQLSSNQMYLIVHQGLKVDTVLRNVQACLNAYLEVQVDGSGHLSLIRRYSDFYVWPGTNGHLVVDGLISAMPLWDLVWDVASGLFNFLTDIPAERAYILPGSQDALPAHLVDSVLVGNTNKDHATIIAQPPNGGQIAPPTGSTIESTLNGIVERLSDMFGAYAKIPLPDINLNINASGTQIINQTSNDIIAQINELDD